MIKASEKKLAGKRVPQKAAKAPSPRPSPKGRGSKAAKTVSRANNRLGVTRLSNLRAQAARVVERLRADYPDATCALENETPFELLVATILSAQCTDERVNMVTPDLFRRWSTAAEMAQAPIKSLETAIQSTGFFRNKAKNIKAASQALM